MTDPRTVSTTVAGEPCRVTSPLLRQEEAAIYVAAMDDTLTALQPDGTRAYFVVKCESKDQAEYVGNEMDKRPELLRTAWSFEPPPWLIAGQMCPFKLIPFRLLPRRWLADWRETADRIEVREGASGSVYMTAVVGGQTVAEKRVPFSCRCDHDAELAKLRAAHPSLWLFDFRPVRGEG